MLTSSTGYEDSASPYSGLTWDSAINRIGSLGKTAAELVSAFNGKPTDGKTASAQTAQNGNPTGAATGLGSSTLLWIVGGAVAIIAVIFFLRK